MEVLMISRRDVIRGTSVALIGAATAAKAEDIESFAPRATQTEGASIATADVNISVQDSPLGTALDIYYDWLIKLSHQSGFSDDKDKLLINNTITSFDIAPDTPFFNEGLFARFADRVFKSSPDNLGTANRADRFSQHYEQLIRIAASAIDQQYDKIVPRVEALQSKLEDQTTQLTNRISTINKQWIDLTTSLGVKPTDPDYELKYI
jgi:hypothetical protein